MEGRNPLLERFFAELQRAVGSAALASREGLTSEELEVVVGVDAAYGDGLVASAAVAWRVGEREVVAYSTHICEPPYPYVPGLLFLREGPPMLEAVKGLRPGWELLLVDAHGVLHPRRAGLAVFLGFILEKPALGVAKSLLVGVEEEGEEVGRVFIEGRHLGYWFRPKGSRKFYVSPGYRVSLEEVPRIMGRVGPGYPEALRLADRLARRRIREELGGG